MSESESSKLQKKWPWDWEKEKLTDAVRVEIVENLPGYAVDAVQYKPEQVGMSGSLWTGFQIYCQITKEYFEKRAKDAPKHLRIKLSQIANDAFGLVDMLVEWVDVHVHDILGNVGSHYPCSHTKVAANWDTLLRKLDLYTSSQGQQIEQVGLSDTNQNILKASGTETKKKVIEKPPPVSPIPVDEAKLKASCTKGKWYDITPSQLEIIKKLNVEPGAWVSGKTMKSSPLSGEQPGQIIDRLPNPIRKRIEGKRGTGFRLI